MMLKMMMMMTMMMMMMLMVVVLRMLMIMMIVMKELVMLMTMTKAMRMVMYPILGTKPFGSSEVAVVQRKNFARGYPQKEGIPMRGIICFIIIYLAQPIIPPLTKHFEKPNNTDVTSADNHNYDC